MVADAPGRRYPRPAVRAPHRPFPAWSVRPSDAIADEIERREYHRRILGRLVEPAPQPQPEPEECWPPLHRFALIVGVSGALWAAAVAAGVWVFRALIGG